jgi:hypothetical protein
MIKNISDEEIRLSLEKSIKEWKNKWRQVE